MRLGFACAWDTRPERTWSHVPWNLRAALRERLGAGGLVDVGITYPPAVRVALKAACARRYQGRWVSMWRHSRLARRYGEVVLRRACRRAGCDVVLQVQDLAALDRPYLLLQDLSYVVLLEYVDQPGGLTHFPTLSRAALRRLRDRQHAIYEQAAGVLAMSRWFAGHLVAVTGLPADRVHVVYPAATAVRPADPAALADRIGRKRHRLLFVGRDFFTKGGDTVVRALTVLRREVDPQITLTVAGPRTWPMPGEVPDGVRFLGLLPVDRLAQLYETHDLFVLPSRFEGFGIAFVEALAQGMPCVARRAFAMPEIVSPGRNGDLVDGDDPAALAASVARLLADDEVYRRTAEAVDDVARYFSWSRAAGDVLDVVCSLS